MKKFGGFTQKQRQWILKRDKYRCSMLIYNVYTRKWNRCKSITQLHAHHIRPRGFFSQHFSKDANIINGPDNGITLCAKHHIGKAAVPEELLYVVHADMNAAITRYRRGDIHAYTDLFMIRMYMNKAGIPYWNSSWDALFKDLVSKRNRHFDIPYPYKGTKTPPIKEGDPDIPIEKADGDTFLDKK